MKWLCYYYWFCKYQFEVAYDLSTTGVADELNWPLRELFQLLNDTHIVYGTTNERSEVLLALFIIDSIWIEGLLKVVCHHHVVMWAVDQW